MKDPESQIIDGHLWDSQWSPFAEIMSSLNPRPQVVERFQVGGQLSESHMNSLVDAINWCVDRERQRDNSNVMVPTQMG
jgi:hypothetical protein